MFKALFVGYLFGIRSERRLIEEIRVNAAYRWFLRMRLTDDVFDASTLSQNRKRPFNGTDIAQTIFDRIMEENEPNEFFLKPKSPRTKLFLEQILH